MRRFTKRWDFRRARIRDYGARLTFSGWCATGLQTERSSGGLMKRHEQRFPSRDTSEPKAQPEMQKVFLLDAGDRPLFFCHDYAESRAMEQHGNRCVWRHKRQRFPPGMCHRYPNAVLVGGQNSRRRTTRTARSHNRPRGFNETASDVNPNCQPADPRPVV